MADYIAREAAIVKIYKFDGYLDDDMMRRLHYALRGIPAADVVPVVRCKDCRFARFGPEWIICENFNGLCTTALGLNDYCSHGERRPQDGKL